MADWNTLKKNFETESSKRIDWMLSEFDKVRTGRANPAIFYEIRVECYGEKTPLNQLANINSPEPRKITIKPYDKSLIKDIKSAIDAQNMGYNPIINGDMLLINIPQPTEETRKLAVKNIKQTAEKTKNELREIRKKILNQIKNDETITEDVQRREEKDLDALVKETNNKVDVLTKTKEKELLTI